MGKRLQKQNFGFFNN